MSFFTRLQGSQVSGAPTRGSRCFNATNLAVLLASLWSAFPVQSADPDNTVATAGSGTVSALERATNRIRLIIETDAGGDPDDEQSLVRFLLYANEWDVEGIIANRARARDGENHNPERTGLGIVRRFMDAYAQCYSSLTLHDPRYPSPDELRSRAVAGYNEVQDGVELILRAIEGPDPRPVWYSDWGTDHGSATNNLRRALDRVLQERGRDAYARLKSRIRLVSADGFGPHTDRIPPAFPLWVDTWRPEIDKRRWYHRFSGITAQAGGFDLVRDCLTGHGPLGALYPTNATLKQKEGDTLSFLYLVPNGMNSPNQPSWGGWGGRPGHNPEYPGQPYFWANLVDTWNGTTHRDNTLIRWAADLQNDFRARLDWCVRDRSMANHPPEVVVTGENRSILQSGETVSFTGAVSRDPDQDRLDQEWILYSEVGTYSGPVEWSVAGPALKLTTPAVEHPESLHFILRVADRGEPPFARYHRLALTILPPEFVSVSDSRWNRLKSFFSAPSEGETPSARPNSNSLLRFDDGRPVSGPVEWAERRREIRRYWDEALGPWPPLLEHPRVEVLRSERREGFVQERVRIQTAPSQTSEGWLLKPEGPGPFPAVLVVYYDPETSVGMNPRQSFRDFALQLTRRGFMTLSLGTPGGDARAPDLAGATCQPLSFHAYVAANAWQVLAELPQVDRKRIGVMGHSYGGKWALFAAAFWDRFAAVAVSDPGIVFDEARANVNYWEPWYLGWDAGAAARRRPGLISADNPRSGAYARLRSDNRDLHEIHALIAPRPLLVSGGSEDTAERWPALGLTAEVNRLLGRPNRIGLTTREGHDPTRESNEQIYEFFELFLASRGAVMETKR